MSGFGIQKKGTSPILKGQAGHGPIPYLNKPGQAQGTHGGKFNKGGRVGLERGGKGIIQKIGEKISRKWRGKEKTEHKGLEQDVKTGAYTHKAPKDRWDTKAGRIHKGIMMGPHLRPGQKLPKRYKPENEQTYAELKKKKKIRLKEEKRKKEFDKKHGVN